MTQEAQSPHWRRASLDQLARELNELAETPLLLIGLCRRLIEEVEQLHLDVDEARNMAAVAQADAENALSRTGYF